MKFRDVMAIIGSAGIMSFWGLQGVGILQGVPSEVNGALIAVFTLVFQFYFRKKPASEKTEG